MFRRPKIYTVHENPDRRDPAERVELVREGFSIWAFLLNVIWLLANKLWVPFFIYFILVIFAVEAQRRLGFGDASMGAIQIALQLLLGFSAHDLQRWALERRGYRMTGVVVGESELLASQRAYDHLAV